VSTGLGQDHRGAVRVGRQLALQRHRQVGAVVVPDRGLHHRDAIEIGSCGGLLEPYPGGKGGRRVRERRREPDHDGLPLFRFEPGGDQPLGQVGREIVAVQLPLDALAARREVVTLAGDQGVEFASGQVGHRAVRDETALVDTGQPHHRPVVVQPGVRRQDVRHPRT
jgi:hypothetical protein